MGTGRRESDVNTSRPEVQKPVQTRWSDTQWTAKRKLVEIKVTIHKSEHNLSL